MVNHYLPNNKLEALKILNEHDCYIMAGGTDLMVQKHRSNQILPNFDKDVLYVSNLEELNYIKEDKDNIYIGASTKYVDLLNSSIIPTMLKDVIKEIASPNIRNMATLVGNIANASPAGDSLVPLYVMNAKVKLESLNSNREVNVSDFILGVRKIDRKKEELITEVIIPKTKLKYMWKKVGSRKAETISKLSFLGAYEISNGVITDLRIAFGSVATTVIRNRQIEQKYIGKDVNYLLERINEILNSYKELLKPIDDHRSSKDYRYKVSINLLEAFIKSLNKE